MTPESLAMIKKLVAFPTVSRDSNMPLINYVQQYLEEHGISSELVPNQEGTKANLYATIGPNVDGGVVLSGHTDVVPVDGQDWHTDPFQIVEKNSLLYGRGTCDMKAFTAIGLAMVPKFLQMNLKRPIHFALSYDEEVGCLGAPSLIQALKDKIAMPSAVIVGEPTSMQAVVAHKGITALRTTVIGHEAHSSQPHRGVSAVMLASKLVSFIDDMLIENRNNAIADSPFQPPYTTLHVGTINGGTAINIMARECSFVWDLRTMPGDDWQVYINRFEHYCNQLLDETKSRLGRIADNISIKTDIFANVPPLNDKKDGAQKLVQQALDSTEESVVSFVSEAGQFQDQGYSVVLCGPGSIDQAHQPNEYIAIDQVTKCESFLERIALNLTKA